jgi:hypothetical protein
MGLFNAVRRYVITSDSDHEQVQPSSRADGIVVVGDGNTRTFSPYASTGHTIP